MNVICGAHTHTHTHTLARTCRHNVLAWLSIGSDLQFLHNPSCNLKCYSLYVSNNLWCHFQWWCPWEIEQKGWDREKWVGIYTQKVKTAWLHVCGFGYKNPSIGSLHKINDPGKQSSRLTEPPWSVQVQFISSHCPSNLNTDVLRRTEYNCMCSLEQENPYA